MYQIHAISVDLVLILLTGRVSPQLQVEFHNSFTTINSSDGNLVPPRYWQAMCGFIKGKKSMFVHYEQDDPSSTFISPSYQGHTTRENSPYQEEQAILPPVQEYNDQKSTMQKKSPEKIQPGTDIANICTII